MFHSGQMQQEVLGGNENTDYHPRSQRELAANIFAAELLIPLGRVQRLYLAEESNPATLASGFGVSNAALLNRLAGLLKKSNTPRPSVLKQ